MCHCLRADPALTGDWFGNEDREKVGHPEAVHAPCPPQEAELAARNLWLRKAKCGTGGRAQERRDNVAMPRAW
jgi:hypothetical protein